jgi:hypothetical protein
VTALRGGASAALSLSRTRLPFGIEGLQPLGGRWSGLSYEDNTDEVSDPELGHC